MTTAQQRVQRGGNFATQFGLMAVAIEKPGAGRRVTMALMFFTFCTFYSLSIMSVLAEVN